MGAEDVLSLQATSRRNATSDHCDSKPELIFDNLVWLSSDEAARYLRKSVGALRVMVCRNQIRARKFRRRLYFKRMELDRLIETSELKGGL